MATVTPELRALRELGREESDALRRAISADRIQCRHDLFSGPAGRSELGRRLVRSDAWLFFVNARHGSGQQIEVTDRCRSRRPCHGRFSEREKTDVPAAAVGHVDRDRRAQRRDRLAEHARRERWPSRRGQRTGRPNVGGSIATRAASFSSARRMTAFQGIRCQHRQGAVDGEARSVCARDADDLSRQERPAVRRRAQPAEAFWTVRLKVMR